MSLRSSHFAVPIRVLLGAILAGGLLSSARAGQKIEYSVPASQVAQPNPAKEQRDAALFPEKTKLQFNSGPDLDFVPPPSIIVNPQPARKRDQTSLFDSKNDKSGPDNLNPNDDASKKALRDKNSENQLNSSRDKNGAKLPGTEFGRTPDLNAPSRDALDRSKNSSDPYSTKQRTAHELGSAWAHDFRSHSLTGADNTGNDSKSLFNHQNPTSSTTSATPGSANDPFRGLGWATANGGKNYNPGSAELSHLDRVTSKPDMASGNFAPNGGSYHPNIPAIRDAQAPSQGSGYFQQGTYTPKPAPPRRVAPPTLEFPKRPGDTLR